MCVCCVYVDRSVGVCIRTNISFNDTLISCIEQQCTQQRLCSTWKTSSRHLVEWARRRKYRNWQNLIYLSLKSYMRRKMTIGAMVSPTDRILDTTFSVVCSGTVTVTITLITHSQKLFVLHFIFFDGRSSLGQHNLFKSIILSVYFIFAHYRFVRNSINHNPSCILRSAHVRNTQFAWVSYRYMQRKCDQMDFLKDEKHRKGECKIDFWIRSKWVSCAWVSVVLYTIKVLATDPYAYTFFMYVYSFEVHS